MLDISRHEKICKITKKYELAVIEDCARTIGASIEDKYVGKFSDFAIFSFQAVKHVTTIDGGFLLYKNSKLHEKLKRLRWFGLLRAKTEQTLNYRYWL